MMLCGLNCPIRMKTLIILIILLKYTPVGVFPNPIMEEETFHNGIESIPGVKVYGDFGETPPAGTDLHHLRPCDSTVNSPQVIRILIMLRTLILILHPIMVISQILAVKPLLMPGKSEMMRIKVMLPE